MAPLARRTVRSLIAFALIIAVHAAGAQPAPQGTSGAGTPQASTISATPDTAVLMVRSRPIVVFRAPLGALSAAERAQEASRRITELAEAESKESISLLRIPQGILVRMGSRGVFTITPADVDSTAAQTTEQVAADAMVALRVAIAEEVQSRSLVHNLTSVALGLLATVVFFFFVRLLRRARVVVLRRMGSVAGDRDTRVAIAGFTIFTRDQVLAFARRIFELLVWALGLFAAYIWLTFVLTRFPYSRPWGEALGGYLVTTLKGMALGIIGSVPGLFTVVLIFLITRFITRVVTAFFQAAGRGEVVLTWLHAETLQPTRQIIVALIWLFAVVIAYPFMPGAGTDVFKGVSVFVGLVLSLGSTGLVNQAMGGLVLMYSRALTMGDYVRVGETEGTVEAVGMLSTKVRTPKNEIITIPNAVMISNTTKNYTRLHQERGIIVYTSVTIGYDTPWRQVQAMLKLAATRTAGIRKEPAPFVLQTALSDFYIEYQLNAYMEEPGARPRVLSDLHAHIADVFNEFGVQITSPHYMTDPAEPKVVPPDAWAPAPAEPVEPERA